MHPQLDEALGRLDAATGDLRAVVATMSPELLARRSSPERWCVNEVLEHLGMVEHLFVTRLVGNIEAAKAAGLDPEVEAPAMLSDHLRTAVEDRSNRRHAPDHVIPSGQVDATTALQNLEGAHTQLRDTLATARGMALSTVTLEHRAFGTLNVYQWVDFLAGHERRHLAQIREIAAEFGQV